MKKAILICLLLLLPINALSAENAFSREDNLFLEMVQKQLFRYFTDCTNPANGLVMDKALNLPRHEKAVDFDYAAASITGVGFALTAFPVGVERGFMSREAALNLTRRTLEFFLYEMEHKQGFFYHFVDMKTGLRAMNCEISSIDTAIFLAGALFAAQYFAEPEIHELALSLYERVDWQWMRGDGKYISMGWTPEKGFIPASWDHYSEGILLYILALGSPTHPVAPELWNFRRLWGKYKGHTHLISPPLFTHQFPMVWLDLKNKRDQHADYFVSSTQATLANRQYSLDLRPSYSSFSENRWGLTACIGPHDYQAYGAPPNAAPADGTVAPAAAGCSIVFTPELSLSALREYYESTELSSDIKSRLIGRFGLSDSFNLDHDFVATEAFAINQGPLLLMIENARSGFIWEHFMKIPFIIKAMKKAGFREDFTNTGPPSNTIIYETKAYLPHLRPVYESAKIPDGLSLEIINFSDTVWNRARPMLLDKNQIQTVIKAQPGMEFQVAWKMLHNQKSIFFRFDVYDPDLHAAHPTEQMYHDDSLEVYLNSLNQPFRWGKEHDFQIILSPDATGKNLRVREFLKGDNLTSSLKWRFRRLPDGYQVVLEIPRDKFLLDQIESFGFSVAAHNTNADNTIDVKYNWFFPLPTTNLGEVILRK